MNCINSVVILYFLSYILLRCIFVNR